MEKSLNECPPFSPLVDSMNRDNPPELCADCKPPTQQDVAFIQDPTQTKTGVGRQAQCDPFQTGQIAQDYSKEPSKDTIYRYSRSVRGTDEAMLDLFRNLIVLDEQGTEHPVPIIWATQERAVAAAIQTNVRKDDSQVVDRIKLPMMAIYSSGFQFNPQRYTYHHALNYFRSAETGKPRFTGKEKKDKDTVYGLARGIPIDITYQLTAWTLYVEDMNQIVEQIILKMLPLAYIRVQGVQWEIVVRMDSIASNLDMEPGDQALRVIKFQFNMTAESYIAQPIARRKSVLGAKIDLVNGVDQDQVTDVYAHLNIGGQP